MTTGFGSPSAPRRARTRVRGAMAVAALALLAGCQKSLPTAPSDLTTGVIVYEHANYGGASAHITSDIKDLKTFKGPCLEFDSSGGTTTSSDVWNDCISSVRVAPGWRVTLFRDDDFDGDRLEVSADIANLELSAGSCSKGGFNDCVTSIRLIRP
jgi:hypothetical protein